MQTVDLDEYGFPGYKLRKDGVLMNPSGRYIYGNKNGQVSLPNPEGRDKPRVWKSLNILVSEVFGWKHDEYGQLETKNLGSFGYSQYYACEDGEIIREHANGKRQIIKGSNGFVRILGDDEEIHWKSIKLLIGMAFIPNPLGRKNVLQYKKLRNQFQLSNLLWSDSQRSYTREDVIVDLWVKNPGVSLERISEALGLSPIFVWTILTQFKLL